jgi:GTP cyclohydrolase II
MTSSSPQIAQTPLNTKYGDFILYVFSWSENEQDNVLALVRGHGEVPLVRIQSACYTGEIFESLDCDCHWQLETSLKSIQQNGGIFIYMLRDGRGAGLLAKVRGMALSKAKQIDTADAYRALGIPADPRHYEHAAYVLRHFSVVTLHLMTNNPRKVAGLEREGFLVERVPLESEPTDFNRDYLRAKATKLGHLMKHSRLTNGE